jgi:hypothetical protein
MATVENPTLTLTTVNNNTKIRVTFNARFTPFDRQLAGLGLIWHPHITVLGIDPPGSTTGTDLFPDDPNNPPPFPHTKFAVTVGTTDQVIAYNVEETVLRSDLQEDSAAGDNDEIRCKIRIHAANFPPEFTEDIFTPQQVLVG